MPRIPAVIDWRLRPFVKTIGRDQAARRCEGVFECARRVSALRACVEHRRLWHFLAHHGTRHQRPSKLSQLCHFARCVEVASNPRLPDLRATLPCVMYANLNRGRDCASAQTTQRTCAPCTHAHDAKRGGGRPDRVTAGANNCSRGAGYLVKGRRGRCAIAPAGREEDRWQSDGLSNAANRGTSGRRGSSAAPR